jgi:3-deoxy-D-manno-octulosonic-acid transferase
MATADMNNRLLRQNATKSQKRAESPAHKSARQQVQQHLGNRTPHEPKIWTLTAQIGAAIALPRRNRSTDPTPDRTTTLLSPDHTATKPPHSVRKSLSYLLVQILTHLALPLFLLLLVKRGIKERGHWRGLGERFGLGSVGPKGAVWIYAASLGETRAASPLIRRLRASGLPVLLTHLSPAGLEEGYRLFPDDSGITHRYMPIDLFWAVRLFLARARPVVGVVMEIEIWPAMMLGARRMGVPMVMANGNLLEKSITKKGWLRRDLLMLYREFAHVFTRTENYRQRYLSLGVAPERISVVGEMKYDQWIDPAHRAMGETLRRNWSVARVVMIASSVRDEEPILLQMVSALLAKDPGLGVLWVPRSPQRFAAVAQSLADAGLTVARRSDLGAQMAATIGSDIRVILGDSIGEMNAYYPVADLVFVGASLVDHGGHNIMEPMAFGKPVLMGPSIYGIAFAAEPAARMGAFESLPTAEALRLRILGLLQDPAERQRMGQAAGAFSAGQAGAADRTYTGLKAIISGTRH